MRDALIQIVLRLREDVLKERDIGHYPPRGAESYYSESSVLSVPSLLPSVPSVTAPLAYDQRPDSRTGLGMLSSNSLYGYGSYSVCLPAFFFLPTTFMDMDMELFFNRTSLIFFIVCFSVNRWEKVAMDQCNHMPPSCMKG